jgi:DNA helicase II / ATP-dependent DNA helicase PcrA
MEKNDENITEPTGINLFGKVYNLNEQQKDAVLNCDGNMSIIAGAGSGKTRCLIGTIAHLIYIGHDPSSIVAITFTKKAHHEIKMRLTNLIGEELTQQINIGTIHSYAYRTLQRVMDINYTILDDTDTKQILIDLLENNPNILIHRTYVHKNLNFIYSNWKDGMYPITLKDLLEKLGFEKYYRQLARLYKQYETYKHANKYLDFSDIMTKFREWVEHNNIDNIEYILVDEAQDLNQLQFEILQHMNKNIQNMKFYGDDWQSIYRFRGGNMTYIVNFEQEIENSRSITLDYNYRSVPEIVYFCNQIMKHNHDQIIKIMKSKTEHDNIDNRPYVECFLNSDDEASWIINKIQNHMSTESPSVAVLARNNAELEALEIYFLQAQLTYRKIRGVNILDRIHIKDIISLWTALEKGSIYHWKRVLRLMNRMTMKMVDTIIAKGKNRIIKVIEHLGTYCDRNTVNITKPLINFIKKYKKIKTHNEKVDSTIEFLSKIYDYDLQIEQIDTKTFDKRVLDLSIIGEEAKKCKTFHQFMESICLEWNDEHWIERLDNITTGNPNPIILSTIHSAKGLEWDIVFIKGNVLGRFPRSFADNVQDFMLDIEEERRLFFVGCSRAKSYLYLTAAPLRSKERSDEYCDSESVYISPFIEEIGKQYYQGENILYYPELKDVKHNITTRIKACLAKYTPSICWDLLNNEIINVINKTIDDEIPIFRNVNKDSYDITDYGAIQWGNFLELATMCIMELPPINVDSEYENDSIYQNYLDPRVNWKEKTEDIYRIANNNWQRDVLAYKNSYKIWRKLQWFKYFEEDIIDLKQYIETTYKTDATQDTDWCYHMSLSMDKIRAELDLYHTSGILIEFKASQKNVITIQNLLQAYCYAYLLIQKNMVIQKIYWYNFLTRQLVMADVPDINLLQNFWKYMFPQKKSNIVVKKYKKEVRKL